MPSLRHILAYGSQLPTALVLLVGGALTLGITYSAWHYHFKAMWYTEQRPYQQAKILTQKLQQARHALASAPSATTLSLSSSADDFSQRISTLALQQQVFIADLSQSDANHWQAKLLGHFGPLYAFLRQLLQQPSTWFIERVDLQRSQVEASPMALNIAWQHTPITVASTSSCLLPTVMAQRPDPFILSHAYPSSLNRYPLAAIEWLGLLRDAHHSAALIRLPDQAIYLVHPGDVIGREHWRLTRIKHNQIDFIDVKQRPQNLSLPVTSGNS